MTTEINCEIIVVYAGPETPKSNKEIDTRSNIIFIADETPIANKGVLLSPIPFKIDKSKLYATVMNKPLNMM